MRDYDEKNSKYDVNRIYGFMLSVPVFAAEADDNSTIESSTYIIDDAVRNADIQRQVDEQLATLIAADSKLRGEYDWVYSNKFAKPKYVTKGGYPSGQLPGGVKFSKPGGAFSWSPEGGPVVSASVGFSAPYKAVTLGVNLGVSKANESLKYVQHVSNYTDHVKLYVNKTMEVKPYITYRTDRRTGKTEEYYHGSVNTMYSFELKVKKV
ncbi:MAG: hypothetical protein E7222_09875 [Clostridiales bacterium]|uniref:hypothetical protein n=1 Tax=Aminipila sp. TaxID=2060095 RepID=UPI001DDDE479|nr:hypothetical protein [Aminipila sp.]MBE6034989.1 hypothetical protein [Clostridiales bacterium]